MKYPFLIPSQVLAKLSLGHFDAPLNYLIQVAQSISSSKKIIRHQVSGRSSHIQVISAHSEKRVSPGF